MNKIFLITLMLIVVFMSGCSRKTKYSYLKSSYNSSNVRTYSSNKNDYSSGLSQKAYKHPTMRPYVIRGIRYYPRDVNVGDTFSGNASWYGPDFHGKLTSNGETYNMYDNTAAHKTLPMNTIVKVTNKRNGLTAIVRINDRGPFIATRIIDLSNTAARKIKMVGAGTAPVKIEVLGFYSKDKRKITKTVQKKVKQKRPRVAVTSSPHALQIASFSNIEGALKIQEEYNGVDGYKTIIKDINTPNGRFFKVYLTGFSSEDEVRNYKVNSDFHNSFIVKED